jgi:hypothetical protein
MRINKYDNANFSKARWVPATEYLRLVRNLKKIFGVSVSTRGKPYISIIPGTGSQSCHRGLGDPTVIYQYRITVLSSGFYVNLRAGS